MDVAWVTWALDHPFFTRPPPKSLDRNEFASLKLRDVTAADGAATLIIVTVEAIARIAQLSPKGSWPAAAPVISPW